MALRSRGMGKEPLITLGVTGWERNEGSEKGRVGVGKGEENRTYQVE